MSETDPPAVEEAAEETVEEVAEEAPEKATEEVSEEVSDPAPAEVEKLIPEPVVHSKSSPAVLSSGKDEVKAPPKPGSLAARMAMLAQKSAPKSYRRMSDGLVTLQEKGAASEDTSHIALEDEEATDSVSDLSGTVSAPPRTVTASSSVSSSGVVSPTSSIGSAGSIDIGGGGGRRMSVRQKAMMALSTKDEQWKSSYYGHGDGAKELRDLMEHSELVKSSDHGEVTTIERRMTRLSEVVTSEDTWRNPYYSSKDGEVLKKEIADLKTMGTSELVKSNLDLFTTLDSEGNDLFKEKLKVMKTDEKRELLFLQLRQLQSKFMTEYEMSVEESNEVVTSMEPDDIDTALEVAFSERMDQYEDELVALQRRFEERVTYYKTFRSERDTKYELTDEQKDEMRRVMEEEMLKRKTKLDDLKFVDGIMKSAFASVSDDGSESKTDTGDGEDSKIIMESAGGVLAREKASMILRELGILIEDDTVIQMSATDIFSKLTEAKCEQLRQILHWSMEDNPRLLSLQIAHIGLTDDWFINDMLPILKKHCKMLTELNIESNPITDRSVRAIADWLETNPPNLRVVKMVNLGKDVSTEVLGYLCEKLVPNKQVCKLSIDTRAYHHRDRITKVCDRNFKNFAKFRRLKRTLLGEIKKNPGLENPTPLSDA